MTSTNVDRGRLHREDTLELFILQPTPFCNISCTYCYLSDRGTKTRMASDTLRKSFERLFSCSLLGSRLTVVWHAGEPLVVPPVFYREAIDIVKQLNSGECKIEFNVQTNGILINQEWCDLFKEFNFRVSVSLDGPAFIHDKQRRTRSGAGTHSDVMKGIELLKRNNIPFNNICVVTKHSLPFPEDIYRFFVDVGCDYLGINIEEIEGENRIGSFVERSRDLELRAFLSAIFHLWMPSPHKLRIREFTGLLAAIGVDRKDCRAQETIPFRILNVDAAGNFAPFSPELLGRMTHHGRFVFGNVWTDSFDSLMTNQRLIGLYEEFLLGKSKCSAECAYYSLCGGGTLSNKFHEHGTFDCTETRYCATNKKMIIDEVLYGVEQEVQRRFA